jgi:hypothetical protein
MSEEVCMYIDQLSKPNKNWGQRNFITGPYLGFEAYNIGLGPLLCSQRTSRSYSHTQPWPPKAVSPRCFFQTVRGLSWLNMHGRKKKLEGTSPPAVPVGLAACPDELRFHWLSRIWRKKNNFISLFLVHCEWYIYTEYHVKVSEIKVLNNHLISCLSPFLRSLILGPMLWFVKYFRLNFWRKMANLTQNTTICAKKWSWRWVLKNSPIISQKIWWKWPNKGSGSWPPC